MKILYEILEQMVQYAQANDEAQVLKLNKEFDKEYLRLKVSDKDALDLEYDRCRQSCVGSLDSSMLISRETWIEDAIKRFKKIEKPD